MTLPVLACPSALEESDSIAPNPALEAQGWKRRNLADPKQAAELTELYRSMGFEVRAEPIAPHQMDEKCSACVSSVCDSYVLLYTRAAKT